MFSRSGAIKREPENGLLTLSGSHRQKHYRPVRLFGHIMSLEFNRHSLHQTDFSHRHTALADGTAGFHISCLVGRIIIVIPMVYLLVTAKHLPSNLAFLNLICALALAIGYSLAGKLKFHFDIRKTFTSIAIRASLGRSRKLKRAIENGIDVNESHIDGRTALMLAARNCKVENVRLLIEAGANITAIDHDGNTALIWASVLGNIKILQMLIDAGSDINAKNHEGKTALDIALPPGFMNKRAIGLLSRHGALKGNELQ
jgi:ankyrin repeat protein